MSEIRFIEGPVQSRTYEMGEDRSESFWGDKEKGEDRLMVARAVWEGCSRELQERFGIVPEEFDLDKLVMLEFSKEQYKKDAPGAYDSKLKKVIMNVSLADDLYMFAGTLAHEIGHYYQRSIKTEDRIVRGGLVHISSDWSRGGHNTLFNEVVVETTMKKILAKVAKGDPVLENLGEFRPDYYRQARGLVYEMIETMADELQVAQGDVYRIMEKGVWGTGGLAEFRGMVERVYGKDGRKEMDRLVKVLANPFNEKVLSATRLRELIRNPKNRS